MRAFNSAAAPQFPHLAAKTYAAHPVWKDSARRAVNFVPLAKRDAVRIFHDARRFERQTSRTRVDAFGRRTSQGKIGRMGIMVLHSLLFDFLNYKSGRLDPSYAAISESALVSVRSVARALVKLKEAGILNWVRRCSEAMDGERYVLAQETNAYGISPASTWKGYRPPPAPPPPEPSAWGATPPLPGSLALAAAALGAGDRRRALALMESDPGDLLAAAAARLGRRFL